MKNQHLGIVLMLTTAPDAETAGAIARSLIDKRLAACANCVPGATSVFRWAGTIESTDEVLVLIKTRAELADRVAETVKKEHPYELPEVLTVPVSGGLAGYLDWIEAETRDASG